ncbi:hypothetical protein DBV15_02452 [Temnothorax longispinosus]|uniref:Uncharacterized protein n=1 Tax=Temnothorax longispinosus TaxID=300112 RepID=A0A4S2L1D9_9HYME|nr:hypothetical protein DBV15_02452 [Temnothorax longispinosus]
MRAARADCPGGISEWEKSESPFRQRSFLPKEFSKKSSRQTVTRERVAGSWEGRGEGRRLRTRVNTRGYDAASAKEKSSALEEPTCRTLSSENGPPETISPKLRSIDALNSPLRSARRDVTVKLHILHNEKNAKKETGGTKDGWAGECGRGREGRSKGGAKSRCQYPKYLIGEWKMNPPTFHGATTYGPRRHKSSTSGRGNRKLYAREHYRLSLFSRARGFDPALVTRRQSHPRRPLFPYNRRYIGAKMAPGAPRISLRERSDATRIQAREHTLQNPARMFKGFLIALQFPDLSPKFDWRTQDQRRCPSKPPTRFQRDIGDGCEARSGGPLKACCKYRASVLRCPRERRGHSLECDRI